MCGRTVVSLAPARICEASRMRSSNGKWSQPQWCDPPGGQQYYPSYNNPPGSHTPVMLSKKHVNSAELLEEPIAETPDQQPSHYIIQPMHWGLVPSWHQGDPKAVMYKMNNARSDGMMSKKSFRGPLDKGRRCVVLVDGYYEWHTSESGKKQPYFIHPQSSPPPTESDDVKVKQEVKDAPPSPDKDNDMPTPRLLAMAGIFDVWQPKNGDPPLYSYTIITVDAHKSLSFIHHRQPVFLNGEDEIRAWLDHDRIPLNKAVELVASKDCVSFYPCSTLVNNVHNKSEECMKPVDLSKPKESKSSAFMSGWLAKAKTGSPTKPGVIKQEMKPEPKKSPKKPNLMTAWLNKAKSPVKQEVKDILKTDIKAEIKQDLKEEPDIKKTKLEM